MTYRPRIKICGITRQSDAALAVSLGADAIGFVFWPRSPRVVTPGAARAIQESLPPFVTRVGVFVDAPLDEIVATVIEAGLDAVQLHGDEPVPEPAAVPARILKVATFAGGETAESVMGWPGHVTPLVDAHDPHRRGGTGQLGDWSVAARVAAARPIVLAGGLTAANVRAALATVRPWAIDVSSGVEDSPGIKSPTRLREFFGSLAAAQREDE